MAPISLADVLSEDLIIQILLMLPVISLLRFQLVCKQWYTIINSSTFMYDHFRQPSNCTKLLVYASGRLRDNRKRRFNYSVNSISAGGNGFTYVTTGRQSDYYIDSISLFPNETQERQLLDKSMFPALVSTLCGPCNGMMLVSHCDSTLALCNLATQKMWPLQSNCAFMGGGHCEFSFWVDALTNEFKVFVIGGARDRPRTSDGPRFYTYTWSQAAWRFFQAEEVPFNQGDFILQMHNYTVLNGFYYFVKADHRTYKSNIIAYDIHNDLFEEIHMPEIVGSRLSVVLDLYDEGLALFSSGVEQRRWLTREANCIDIWLMKEKGCWSKLFRVTLPDRVNGLVGFWKENQIFVSTRDTVTHKPVLMIYDCVSGEMQTIEVECTGDDGSRCALTPLRYKESLIAVNR